VARARAAEAVRNGAAVGVAGVGIGASALPQASECPNKWLVEIGEGTHFVMLEKNWIQLFLEVQFFLDGAHRN